MDWWLLTFFIGAIFSLFLPIVPVLFQLILLFILAIFFLYHKKLRTSSGLFFGALWLLINAYNYEQRISISLEKSMQAKESMIIEGRILTLTNTFNEIITEKTSKTGQLKFAKQDAKFNFEVTKINNDELRESIIIRLNWNKVTVSLGQGQLLRLKVKLKPAHGLSNLGGFNYQAWLKSKNIVATGYVVNDRKHTKNNQLLANKSSFRQQFFNQYQTLLQKRAYYEQALVPFMFALVFGERSQLTAEHWDILQATGTGHLIAISGLHIGLVASGGYVFVMLLVRLLPFATVAKLTNGNHFSQFNNYFLNCNSRYVAIAISVAIALFYGFLAGYSLPTQRALVMLGLYWLARLLGVKLSIKRWFLLTLFILLMLSPFSLFTASFWLSVYAVSFIFLTLWRFRYYLKKGNSIVQFCKGLFIIQISLTLMLLPINALFFQQISVVAFFANIVAVPWMSFISIPFALLSAVTMPFSEFLAQHCIQISIGSMSLLWQYLVFIADFSFAQQMLSHTQQQLSAIFAIVAFILIFLGGAISIFNQNQNQNQNQKLSPHHQKNNILNRSISVVGIFTLLIMGSNQITPTKTIESTSVVIKANNTLKSKLLWQLHLFDVGQGLSVLITQKNQALLYDTGASYPSGFNMVDSVILPYLQYAGIKELDKVFLSHSDNDHAGGLSQLMSGIKVKQLISNDSQLIAPYQNTQSCYQGMNFNWKGLSVSALWPIAAKIKGGFYDL